MVDWVEIRKRVEAGESMASVAEDYDIHAATISRHAATELWAVNGNIWLSRVGDIPDMPWTGDHAKLKVVSTILRRIAGGDTQGVACRVAGVSVSVFNAWRRRSEAFSLLVDQASAGTESALLGSIRDKAQSDWKAASWYLGRLRPAEFGSQDAAAAPRISIAIDLAPPAAPAPIDVTPASPDLELEGPDARDPGDEQA